MVNVQIDGVWMQFPKGTRMIEACRQAKKDVPHYCYHPKLTSPGNCRMCLVEMGMPARTAPGQDPQLDENGRSPIQWIPRPAIACANTVADGMGIRTDSTLTRTCRQGVMEFLLINHPLDCPICDQAGECSLQEFSVEHGTGTSRFQERKVKKPKNQQIGPRITLDDERCIMCSRCIRFSKEIADDDCLGFVDRGSHTVLTTHPDKELANNYSLNTVDICPVGALTSTDFRFKMRVWFLKETKSICTGCGRGCNVEISSRESKVHRQTPRENNDVNSCWMCDEGRLDVHYVNSDARLTDPMVKVGVAHRPVAWQEAIATTAGRLKSLSGDDIAIIGSGRMTNEELFMLKRLANALGTDLVDIVPRTGAADNYLVSADKNPNTTGAKLILGITPGDKLDGIRNGVKNGSIKGLLVFGENLMKAGFERADFTQLNIFAASHILANPTAEAAHVVFAGSASMEKRGSMINRTGRLQRLNKAIEPPGNALDEWEILRDLTLAIGGGNGMYSIEDVFKLLATDVKELNGLTLSRVGDLGIQVCEPLEKIPMLEKEAERKQKGLIVG
jgi:NADH-quinone oxidoreductase subunit G